MSVEEIKRGLTAMSVEEQAEVSKFLRCLRLAADQEHRDLVTARLDDKDPSHWISLNELQRRFPGDW